MKNSPCVRIAARGIAQTQEAVVDKWSQQTAPPGKNAEHCQWHEEYFCECHKTENVPALVIQKIYQPRAKNTRTASKLIQQGQRKACRVEQGEKKHRQQYQCHGLGKQKNEGVEKVVAAVLNEKLAQEHA